MATRDPETGQFRSDDGGGRVGVSSILRRLTFHNSAGTQNDFDVDDVEMPFIGPSLEPFGDSAAVPFIHAVEFDYGATASDIAPTDDFVEWFMQLVADGPEPTEMQGRDDLDAVVAQHAKLIWETTNGAATEHDHHGARSQWYPVPIAYPFDNIYFATFEKNHGSVKGEGAYGGTLYYTLHLLDADDVFILRDQWGTA